MGLRSILPGQHMFMWTHKHAENKGDGSQSFGVRRAVCVCVGHLEHKSTHAEDHAKQVHVVRRGVLQCRVGLCAGRFVPVTTQTYFNQRQLKGKLTVSWSLLKSLVLSLYK